MQPEDFGLERSSLDYIKVETAADSLAMIQLLLAGKEGAAADIVALNAGAAVYVSGNADSLAAGVAKAKSVLANGEAKAKLAELVEISKA
jgi:anthranilate phosphoribosyltransferase